MNKYKLQDLFDLQMGKTPSRARSEYWNDGANPWVSIADLSTYSKYVGETKETISEEGVRASGIRVVPSNTVVMSFKLSLGKVAITTKPIYTNEAIMAFVDRGVRKLLPDYIYYLFAATDWSAGTNKAVKGTTLNKATLGIYEIKVPTLLEQTEVVSVFDKVASLIAIRKAQLDALDLLIKSRFVEMFGDPVENPMGWEVAGWKDLFNTATGKLDSNAMVDNGEYPFFTCAKEVFSINTYAFDCEALLLAGNNAAGVFDVKHYKGKFNAYQRTYVLILKDSSRYEVYKILLEHKLGRMKELSKGTNTRYLTLGILESFEFMLPPLPLQTQFANFVHQVDKSKLEVQQALTKLETLRDSLMQHYFG